MFAASANNLFQNFPHTPPPPPQPGHGHRLKTGIDFAYFGLESGMVFEGATGVYERICRFSSR